VFTFFNWNRKLKVLVYILKYIYIVGILEGELRARAMSVTSSTAVHSFTAQDDSIPVYFLFILFSFLFYFIQAV